MSGTSMDGVDASIVQSDGKVTYRVILDKYFEYPKTIYRKIIMLRDKIKNSKDLKIFEKKIKSDEKEITVFHAKVVNKILKKTKINIDFIGFHGQTVFHNPNAYSKKDRITVQLADGKLLSKLTKKKVIYNFRQEDLKYGGQGAPLTPIFHKLLVNQFKIYQPVVILNIGGISNITHIKNNKIRESKDIGPGNCLIDQWIRKKSKKKFDLNGAIAASGIKNDVIFDKALFNWDWKMDPDHHLHESKSFESNMKKLRSKLFQMRTYDIKDFDLSFAEGLSLEDGAATLTSYTAAIISNAINRIRNRGKIVVCGGGRKNNFLMKKILETLKTSHTVEFIDKFGIDGDFIESQAFAYLAIRSYLKLPITFPETTGCKEPCLGGILVNDF
jgi:anhydro-N-acetylmuramic acid kinase